jgi:hypothetical protein
MGLLSWLFPSEADRVAKARKFVDDKRWADARNELLGLEGPEVVAVRQLAEAGLVGLNLDEAVHAAAVGDEERAAHHLQLAQQFHHGGQEEKFTEVRRLLREERSRRERAVKRAAMAEREKLLSIHPSFQRVGEDEETALETEALRERVGRIIETWPEALREGFARLGAPFTQAVLDIEDGRPDLAADILATLPDHEPLVWFERARLAFLTGDLNGAANGLRRFAERAGGHVVIGQLDTAELLRRIEAEGAGGADRQGT